MTIEIEAGASQSQCSMETASVHAVSRSKNQGRVDRSSWAAIAGHRCHRISAKFVFGERRTEKRETPSLSLRLRSVRIFVAFTNAARTLSDVVRPFSGSVRAPFDDTVIRRPRFSFIRAQGCETSRKPDRQNGNRIPLSFNFSNRAATNR